MNLLIILSMPLLMACFLVMYHWYNNRDYFIVKLIRHGESTQNTGEEDVRDVGDHAIRLTKLGWQQALQRGQLIGREALLNGLIYFSPYRRTRETRNAILLGAGFNEREIETIPRYEDPLLREVEHGYEDIDVQESKRAIHGYFYYRFDGGESPADAYDRITGFIEALWHQVDRKFRFEFLRRITGKPPRVVYIIGHGLSHRLFVMRWLHLTVEEFDLLANPNNCDVITIAPTKWLKNPQFTCGRWGVEGLKLRK